MFTTDDTDPTDPIRHYLDLFFDNYHMCMDGGPSKCAAHESVEGKMESVEIDVLDDCSPRVGVGVGGSTVFWREGDKGRI